MLIEDNKLNIKKFKEFFPKLEWVRVPRTLTHDHTDYFYIGTYEDKDLKVSATIRPSMFMQLYETQKNMTQEGKKPTTASKSLRLVNWSSSVEVKVDDSFVSKVKSVAKEQPVNKNEIVSWD